MPDCTICLVTFAADDEIIVFTCDNKHYFHSKCGQDWLSVKTECPLCRSDFTDAIHAFIQNEDIINEVARETIQESSSNLEEEGRPQTEQISQEQVALNELVRELTASMGELHSRINQEESMARRNNQNHIILFGPQPNGRLNQPSNQLLMRPSHRHLHSIMQIGEMGIGQMGAEARSSSAHMLNNNGDIELGQVSIRQQQAIYEDIQRRRQDQTAIVGLPEVPPSSDNTVHQPAVALADVAEYPIGQGIQRREVSAFAEGEFDDPDAENQRRQNDE